MGNCFFCRDKVELKDDVTDDERVRPENKLTLFFSEELNCYMLGFKLKSFQDYYFRLWPEGERSTYISESSDSDSGIDVADPSPSKVLV